MCGLSGSFIYLRPLTFSKCSWNNQTEPVTHVKNTPTCKPVTSAVAHHTVKHQHWTCVSMLTVNTGKGIVLRQHCAQIPLRFGLICYMKTSPSFQPRTGTAGSTRVITILLRRSAVSVQKVSFWFLYLDKTIKDKHFLILLSSSLWKYKTSQRLVDSSLCGVRLDSTCFCGKPSPTSPSCRCRRNPTGCRGRHGRTDSPRPCRSSGMRSCGGTWTPRWCNW